MPPLRGLGLGGSVFLHRYHSYGIQKRFEVFKVSAEYPVGIQERFEVFKVSAEYPVRLRCRSQPPFIPPYQGGRRVRRKTEPTGPGAKTVIVSKIDTYGSVS
ncbi:hypothetical protein F4054_01255 [Candidatus Poribacteria bacterium]|nr:hypothetical protein [Candidatus Poribacteria bacterium]MYK20867.1 hypothetical protein [Candidatus Poribacteria bacterium]